jgi:hypothetical protein
MGVGPSANADAVILVVASAVFYFAWRNAQLQREVRSLRDELGVGLQELEEELLPALQSLIEKTAMLKREVRALGGARRPVERPVDAEASVPQYEEEPEELALPRLLGSAVSTGSVGSVASIGSIGSLVPLLLLGSELTAQFQESTAQIESDDETAIGQEEID